MVFILSEGINLLPILLAAVALVAVPFISKVAEWMATLVHEVGHGIIAIPFGGRTSIKVASDGSGSADTEYSDSLLFKPVRIFSLLMGYAFPIYVGIALLISAYYNMPIIGAWILGVIGVILIFSIRNIFGFLLVLGYSAAFFVFFIMNNFLDDMAFVIFMGIVFLIRGIMDFIFVAPLVFGEDNDEAETDFHILQEEALLPPQFWYVFFVLLHGGIIFFFLTNVFPISFAWA